MAKFTRTNRLSRLALVAVAVGVMGLPVAAAASVQGGQSGSATVETARPNVTKAVYREAKGRLVIYGSGFDESAVIRVNGVEVTGERKFAAGKGKLRITVPAAQLALKAAGQNRVEVIQQGASSGEFTF